MFVRERVDGTSPDSGDDHGSAAHDDAGGCAVHPQGTPVHARADGARHGLASGYG